MSKKTKITLGVVALLVVAIVVGVVLWFNRTPGNQKEVDIVIVSERDNYNETIHLTTDQDTLGDYIGTNPDFNAPTTEYGLYIAGYKGMMEDTDNQYWWRVSVMDEISSVGVSEIPLIDGNEYEIELVQGW